ncbi:MAG: hypothetical protein IKA20_00800 [Clostridia bacterium]|nr:hypothetical protein [Clostridia bacterium]
MKKILTGILATLCVGALVGGAMLANNVNASAATNLPIAKEDIFELDAPPACRLTLEETKVKGIKAGNWGYYNAEGDDVWYFSHDGTPTSNNPEIRFVTDGTQTTSKPYTYAPIEVESFSFDYRIANDGEADVADLENTHYIVQILASDGTYPIILPFIQDDGEWHTITVNQTTPITNGGGNRVQYRDVDHLFAGFLFKMGGLDGEFMIRNINLVVVGEENVDASTPSTPSTPSAPNNSSTSTDKSETSGSTENMKKSGGCGAIIGGSIAASLLVAAGAALFLRKKENN